MCFFFMCMFVFLNKKRETCLFKDNLKHLHLLQPEKQGSLLSKVNIFGICDTSKKISCDFPV